MLVELKKIVSYNCCYMKIIISFLSLFFICATPLFAQYNSYWGLLSQISGSDIDVGVRVYFPDSTAAYAQINRKINDSFSVGAGYAYFINSSYYDNITYVNADHKLHYDANRQLLFKAKYDFLHINFKDVSYTGTILRTKFSLTKQQGRFYHFMGVQIPIYVNTTDESFTMKGESVESYGYIGSSFLLFEPISVTAMLKKDVIYYGVSLNLKPLPVYILFNQDEHGNQQVSMGTQISAF